MPRANIESGPVRVCGMCKEEGCIARAATVRVPALIEWVCQDHAEMFWRGVVAGHKEVRELERTLDASLLQVWEENERHRAGIVDANTQDSGPICAVRDSLSENA